MAEDWPRDLIIDGRLVAIIYSQQVWDWLTGPRPPRAPDRPGHFGGIPIRVVDAVTAEVK